MVPTGSQHNGLHLGKDAYSGANNMTKYEKEGWIMYGIFIGIIILSIVLTLLDVAT